MLKVVLLVVEEVEVVVVAVAVAPVTKAKIYTAGAPVSRAALRRVAAVFADYRGRG